MQLVCRAERDLHKRHKRCMDAWIVEERLASASDGQARSYNHSRAILTILSLCEFERSHHKWKHSATDPNSTPVAQRLV